MKKIGFAKSVYLLVLAAISVLAACQTESRPQTSIPGNRSVEEEEALGESQSQSDVRGSTSTVTAVATDQPPEPKPSSDQKANADVLFVEARLTGDGSWTFSVTIEHEDTGWEDYADGWDVVLPDGSVIKPDPESPFTRLLLHPHENEQPFTRSQSGIEIPMGIDTVTVRAHDLVDGFGGQEVAVDLSIDSGQDFEVIRSQR